MVVRFHPPALINKKMMKILTILLFIIGFKKIFFGNTGERERLDKFYETKENKRP